MRARTTIARLTLLLPAYASSLLPFFCPPYQPHILQRRCTSPRLDSGDDEGIESLLRTVSREDLELVLTELESMRRYVSTDVAKAAMQAAREKSSIDEFISNLQDEVNSLGDSIATDLVVAQWVTQHLTSLIVVAQWVTELLTILR